MHNAEVYVVFLRPNRVPVAGESPTLEFIGQVELNLFEWTLHNEQEVLASEDADEQWSESRSKLQASSSKQIRARHLQEDMEEDLARLDAEYDKTRESLLEDLRKGKISADDFASAEREARADSRRGSEQVASSFQRNLKEVLTGDRDKSPEEQRQEARSKEVASAERNRNFEFTFTKRVDIATTQLLNSMKSGDIFPSATITIVQRPLPGGTVLTLNVQKIRLLDYALLVEQTDTMTHLTEQWTCEFGALGYVYKNASQTHSAKSGRQAATTAMTQGTVRAFTMRSSGSPI